MTLTENQQHKLLGAALYSLITIFGVCVMYFCYFTFYAPFFNNMREDGWNAGMSHALTVSFFSSVVVMATAYATIHDRRRNRK